jgi:hypothetical protein
MDVERVCLALDVGPDELLDVSRREAARLLRVAAEKLDDPDVDVNRALDVAQSASRWLVLCELFDESGGGTETEAKPIPTPAAAADKSSQPEDWSA